MELKSNSNSITIMYFSSDISYSKEGKAYFVINEKPNLENPIEVLIHYDCEGTQIGMTLYCQFPIIAIPNELNIIPQIKKKVNILN